MNRIVLLALLCAACGSEGTPLCYIEAGFYGNFKLVRDIPFWFDRLIGVFASVDSAVAAATTLGCEVTP